MPEPAFALPPTMTPDAVPKAPRKVSRRARRVALGLGFGQDVFLVVGLGFLGIGSILATVFCWGLPIDLALDVAGRAAPAQVVSMELDSNVTVNDLHPMAVRFRYAANGAEYVGQSYTTSQEL